MKTTVLAAAAIGLAGCASSLPTPQTGADPADPTVSVSVPRYVPVTAGNTDYRPVEPKSWRDLNDRVAPGARRTP